MSAQWTLPELAAAVAALPAGTSNAAAAAALAAQVTTVAGVPFTVHQAKLIAMMSANVSWARIVARSRQTPNLPPTSAADAAILSAIAITEMSDDQVVDPSVPAAWGAWIAGLAALEAAGDLIASDVTGIGRLTSVTTPTWTPLPTEADVAAAVAFNATGG